MRGDLIESELPGTPFGDRIGSRGVVSHRAMMCPDGDHSHGITFKVYEVTAWETDDRPACFQEVAHLYVKWDECAHVGFRDPGLHNEWVHVCGASSMREALAVLKWAWNLAAANLRAKGHEVEDC